MKIELEFNDITWFILDHCDNLPEAEVDKGITELLSKIAECVRLGWKARAAGRKAAGAVKIPSVTSTEAVVVELIKIVSDWDTLDLCSDTHAYKNCAERLEKLIEELMPQFECCWCRDHAKLEEDEYTYKAADIGGWCTETGRLICKDCKFSDGIIKPYQGDENE